MTSKKIPNIYLYIYIKLKKKSKTNIITVKFLREVLGRMMIRCGGIPRGMIKYVIDDLLYFDIINRINFNTYKINEINDSKRFKFQLEYGF